MQKKLTPQIPIRYPQEQHPRYLSRYRHSLTASLGRRASRTSPSWRGAAGLWPRRARRQVNRGARSICRWSAWSAAGEGRRGPRTIGVGETGGAWVRPLGCFLHGVCWVFRSLMANRLFLLWENQKTPNMLKTWMVQIIMQPSETQMLKKTHKHIKNFNCWISLVILVWEWEIYPYL